MITRNPIDIPNSSSSMIMTTLLLSKSYQVNAIGNRYEYKDQPMIFQDISLNVANTYNDAIMFKALFQDICQTIRSSSYKGTNSTTIAVGADAYKTISKYIVSILVFGNTSI